MDSETTRKIEELQHIEGGLQNILMQKQSLQIELNEINNALVEIDKSDEEVYKMTAGFMIRISKADIKTDLVSKKKILDMKIDAIEKQERLIEKNATKLRAEVNELMSE
jgi:prefoldin beta subunit